MRLSRAVVKEGRGAISIREGSICVQSVSMCA